MSKISVVIPVYNQSHFTKRCLPSLIDGAVEPQELIIIDNNSTDDTPKYLKEFQEYAENKNWKMQIITNPQNVGVGAAFNQGIKAASAEYVALGNNDTWIMPGWDNALINAIETLKADMVGPHFDESLFNEKEILEKAKKFVKKNHGRATREWAVILMMFKKEVFEKIGLFDERFFITYEDRDLRERMDRAGMKYYKTGNCYIWHHSKGTRDAGGVVSNYEADSLKKFIEKWGFDPRPQENTLLYRYKRKWVRFKNRLGYL
ncbi:MAG: glycosyltransferase family 2 protein [Oligoflexia bacterium]|nr:glycosyltransferase family 2 protein [Oligoflexia bacterium]